MSPRPSATGGGRTPISAGLRRVLLYDSSVPRPGDQFRGLDRCALQADPCPNPVKVAGSAPPGGELGR